MFPALIQPWASSLKEEFTWCLLLRCQNGLQVEGCSLSLLSLSGTSVAFFLLLFSAVGCCPPRGGVFPVEQ